MTYRMFLPCSSWFSHLRRKLGVSVPEYPTSCIRRPESSSYRWQSLKLHKQSSYWPLIRNWKQLDTYDRRFSWDSHFVLETAFLFKETTIFFHEINNFFTTQPFCVTWQPFCFTRLPFCFRRQTFCCNSNVKWCYGNSCLTMIFYLPLFFEWWRQKLSCSHDTYITLYLYR